MIKIQHIFEQVIGSVSDKIEVIIDINKSKHAGQRQYRHGMQDFIQDKQIKKAIEDAVQQIAKSLIFDQMNIDQYVCVINRKFNPNLNIVGVITRKGQKLIFKVLTIMRKDGFKVKPETYRLEIK